MTNSNNNTASDHPLLQKPKIIEDLLSANKNNIPNDNLGIHRILSSLPAELKTIAEQSAYLKDITTVRHNNGSDLYFKDNKRISPDDIRHNLLLEAEQKGVKIGNNLDKLTSKVLNENQNKDTSQDNYENLNLNENVKENINEDINKYGDQDYKNDENDNKNKNQFSKTPNQSSNLKSSFIPYYSHNSHTQKPVKTQKANDKPVKTNNYQLNKELIARELLNRQQKTTTTRSQKTDDSNWLKWLMAGAFASFTGVTSLIVGISVSVDQTNKTNINGSSAPKSHIDAQNKQTSDYIEVVKNGKNTVERKKLINNLSK